MYILDACSYTAPLTFEVTFRSYNYTRDNTRWLTYVVLQDAVSDAVKEKDGRLPTSRE